MRFWQFVRPTSLIAPSWLLLSTGGQWQWKVKGEGKNCWHHKVILHPPENEDQAWRKAWAAGQSSAAAQVEVGLRWKGTALQDWAPSAGASHHLPPYDYLPSRWGWGPLQDAEHPHSTFAQVQQGQCQPVHGAAVAGLLGWTQHQMPFH